MIIDNSMNTIPMNNIDQPVVKPVEPEPLIQVSITSEGGVKWGVINQGKIQNFFIKFTQWLPDHQKEIVTTRLYTITRLEKLLSSKAPKDFVDEKLIRIINKENNKQNPSSFELENFVKTRYFNSCYEKFRQNFPELALDQSLMEQRLTELADLNCSIVDNSDLIFENQKLNDALQTFKETYGKLNDDQKNQCKHIIADMLLSTSLVPTRHRQKKKEGRCYHEALQPFSIQDIVHVLSHLDHISPRLFDDKKDNNGFKFNYLQASYPQKLILLSLLNFNDNVATLIKEDPLFQKIYSRKDLYEWMFAASSKSVEQKFLNTCAAASQQQRILGRIGTIGGLNAVGKALMNGIKWPTEDQTHDTIQTDSLDWESKMGELAGQENIDPAALHSSSRKWGRIFQKMSLTTDTNKRSEPIAKPIKNHWLTSAFLMIIPTLIEFIKIVILRQYKGQEQQNLAETYTGADTKDLQKFVDDHLFLVPPSQVSKCYQGTDLHVLLSQAADQKQWVKDLWLELFESGGTTLENSGHCFFLKAIQFDGKHKFLLSDPKVSHYRIFDQDEFAAFLERRGRKQNQALFFPNSTQPTSNEPSIILNGPSTNVEVQGK